MTNGIRAIDFSDMTNTVTIDSPFTPYSSNPFQNPNYSHLYQYIPPPTPPHVYHNIQPPPEPQFHLYTTPQTSYISISPASYIQPPPSPRLYTPPHTLTCHTTLSIGQPFYVVESLTSMTSTSTLADSQLMVAHQVFDGSPETPTTISDAAGNTRYPIKDEIPEIFEEGEGFADTSRLFKEMPSNKVTQPSLTPTSVSLVSIVDNLVDSGTDVICESELDDGVGRSSVLDAVEIEMTVEYVGGQLVLDWVPVLGGNAVFKGSGYASDGSGEFRREEGSTIGSMLTERDEDSIAKQKGVLNGVEITKSDDDMCLFKYAMKVFDESLERVLALDGGNKLTKNMMNATQCVDTSSEAECDNVMIYNLHEDERGKAVRIIKRPATPAKVNELNKKFGNFRKMNVHNFDPGGGTCDVDQVVISIGECNIKVQELLLLDVILMSLGSETNKFSGYLPPIRRGHYGLLDVTAKWGILRELVARVLATELYREKLDEYIEERQALAAANREETLAEGRKRGQANDHKMHLNGKQATKMEDATYVLYEMNQAGVEPDVFIYITYIDGLCLHGSSALGYDMLKLWRSAKVPFNAFAYLLVIRGFVSKKKLIEAENVLVNMEELGIALDVDCYRAFIQGMGFNSKASDQFRNFKKMGICLDGVVYNITIDALGKLGKLQEDERDVEEQRATLSTAHSSPRDVADIKSGGVLHNDAINRNSGQKIVYAKTILYPLQLNVKCAHLELVYLVEIQALEKDGLEGNYGIQILNQKLGLVVVDSCFFNMLWNTRKAEMKGIIVYNFPNGECNSSDVAGNNFYHDAEFYEFFRTLDYVEVEVLNVVVNLIIVTCSFQDEKWQLKFGVTIAQKKQFSYSYSVYLGMVIDTAKHNGEYQFVCEFQTSRFFTFIKDIVGEVIGSGNYKELTSLKDYATRMQFCENKPFYVTWNRKMAVENFLLEKVKNSLVVLFIVDLIDECMVGFLSPAGEFFEAYAFLRNMPNAYACVWEAVLGDCRTHRLSKFETLPGAYKTQTSSVPHGGNDELVPDLELYDGISNNIVPTDTNEPKLSDFKAEGSKSTRNILGMGSKTVCKTTKPQDLVSWNELLKSPVLYILLGKMSEKSHEVLQALDDILEHNATKQALLWNNILVQLILNGINRDSSLPSIVRHKFFVKGIALAWFWNVTIFILAQKIIVIIAAAQFAFRIYILEDKDLLKNGGMSRIGSRGNIGPGVTVGPENVIGPENIN